MKMLLIAILITFSPFLNADTDTLTEEESEILNSLDWKGEGTHELPRSNSYITLPEGFIALFGNDALIARKIDGEMEDEDLEAAIYCVDSTDLVCFECNLEGYVSIDDWNDVDPTVLLESISEATEIGNAARAQLGAGPLHVIGWIQEPTLDKKTNTVYWSIEGSEKNDKRFINATALKLSRNGFERVVWVTEKASYKPLGGLLDTLLSAHSYDPGYSYTDHTSSDKIAGYSIAALVAAVTGGNIAKAGGFTALLVLLKKGGAFVLAAAAALLYKFKNLFSRTKSEK